MSGKDPSVLLLEHHLKALKLPTILRDYASLAAVCSQEHSSFAQYLLRLVERELIDRERRAAERRIKEAAFPVIKTIDSFDFKVQPSINEPMVRELLRGEYMAKKENVLLVGNAGTGKTHLATALGFAACSQGRRVRFYTTTGLVTQLLEAREERTMLIRLAPSVVKRDVGRWLRCHADAEQALEGVEGEEPPVEAERELVQIRLQVLRRDPVVNAIQPRLQVAED